MALLDQAPTSELGLRRLASIVAGSTDAIVSCGDHGEVVHFNPAAERLLGWTSAEIIGRHVSVLIPPARQQQTRELWARARAGHAVAGVETERLHRDGHPVHVAVTLARDGTGSSLAGSALYCDRTAQRLAQSELAARARQLRELSARERETIRALAPSAPPERQDDRSLVDRILTLVRDELDMDVAWLTSLDDDSLRLQALSGRIATLGSVGDESVPLERTACHLMLRGEAPAAIPDARREPNVRDLPVVRDGHLGSYIGVPVELADGSVYGTLCAADAAASPSLGPREVGFLRVLAATIAEQIDLEQSRRARHRADSEMAAAQALTAALDARDQYTGEHSHAVVELSRAVGAALGMTCAEIESVAQVALLHDLGKVGVPDAVLRKRGPLTDTEWEVMREHPAIGARIVASIESLAHLAPTVRAEHERWDGTGYPDGLTGDAIPLGARITLACDAFHAMISDRPYRRAMDAAAACAELRANAGTQFDPTVVAALIGVLERAQPAGAGGAPTA